MVDAVLLQPLPFADQDELVVLWEKDDTTDNPTSRSRCRTSRTGASQARSFASMAAMGSTTWGEVEVQENPPVRLTISAVSASFFDTLGAQPLLGGAPELVRLDEIRPAVYRVAWSLSSAASGTATPPDPGLAALPEAARLSTFALLVHLAAASGD